MKTGLPDLLRQSAATHCFLLSLWLLAASPATVAAGSTDGKGGLAERWRLRTGQPPSGAPTGDANAVFTVTDRGKVFAAGLDGRELWQRRAGKGTAEDTETEIFTAPPLLVDNTLLFGSRRGTLYAVDSTTGKERWTYNVGGPVTAAPSLLAGKDGQKSIVVISQSDGTVHSVDLVSGQNIRTSPPTNRCDGSAAVNDGTIAYGNCDAALYLLSSKSLQITGKIALRPEGQVFAGVVLADGVIFAGDRRGRLYAANVESGAILWVNEESRGDISSTPAVSENRVFYSSDDGTVASLERVTGRTLWRTALDGRPKGPVITPGSGVLVSADGTLHLLSLEDGSMIWSREISDEITSPAVIAGLVVVASDDGFVIAFGLPPASGENH